MLRFWAQVRLYASVRLSLVSRALSATGKVYTNMGNGCSECNGYDLQLARRSTIFINNSYVCVVDVHGHGI